MDYVYRPGELMSGLRIDAEAPDSGQRSGGTLTAVATRNSDGKKVLVSNLHVLSPASFEPSGNERVYQGFDETSFIPRKVDTISDWVRPTEYTENGQSHETTADVAVAMIDDGIETGYLVHNPGLGTPVLGPVVPGVEEPYLGMEVVRVGAVSGLSRATVVELDKDISTASGLRHLGLVAFTDDPHVADGDSGAPYLAEIAPQTYRMVGVHAVSNYLYSYGIPAPVVESGLGITFGDPEGTVVPAQPAQSWSYQRQDQGPMQPLGRLRYGSVIAEHGVFEFNQQFRGKYARFYTFTVDYPCSMNLAPRGSDDATTFVIEGHGTGGHGPEIGNQGVVDLALEPGDYTIVVTDTVMGTFTLDGSIGPPFLGEIENVEITPTGKALAFFTPLPAGVPPTLYQITALGRDTDTSVVVATVSSPVLMAVPAGRYSFEIVGKITMPDGRVLNTNQAQFMDRGERPYGPGTAAFLDFSATAALFGAGDTVTDGTHYGKVELVDSEGAVWYYTFLDQSGNVQRLPESELSFVGTKPPAFQVGDHLTTSSVHGVVQSMEWDAGLQVWYYTVSGSAGNTHRLPGSSLMRVPGARFGTGDHVTDGANHGLVTGSEWVPASASWFYSFTDQNSTVQFLAESVLSRYGLLPVTNLAANGGATSGIYRITWVSPSAFDSTTDSFELGILRHGETTWTTHTNVANGFTVSTVEEGETWRARVRVMYLDGYSPYETVSITRPVATVGSGGSPPVNLRADHQGGPSYKVSWEAPSDFDGQTDRFEFQVDDGDGWIPSDGAEWAWTWFTTNLDFGETVSIRVRTKYIDGTSITYSDYVSISFTQAIGLPY